MSTIDKKKALSSSKHSMKEHHDEMTDNNNRETKNINEISIEEVHTANDWEHADLGDNQRKQKFLRLMGAKKRKDESRADLNDYHNANPESEKKHSRSQTANETISRELEKQFNECLQSKILHTHHEGLGFHSDESNPSSSSLNEQHQHFVPATTKTRLSSSNEPVTKQNKFEP